MPTEVKYLSETGDETGVSETWDKHLASTILEGQKFYEINAIKLKLNITFRKKIMGKKMKTAFLTRAFRVYILAPNYNTNYF